MGVGLGRAKFQPSNLRVKFSNLGLNKGGKNARFSKENWPYLGNCDR